MMVPILLSTDDGPDAAGLRILSEALSARGLDHVQRPSHTAETSTGTWKGTPGRPTCAGAVSTAIAEFAPGLILIGINAGPNVWPQAIHSGTIGGALVAISLGVSVIAISLDDVFSTGSGPEVLDWDAARWAARTMSGALEQLPRQPFAVSVNVPSRPPAGITGAAVAGWPSLAAGAEEELLARSSVSIVPLGSVTGPIGGSIAAATVLSACFKDQRND